MSEDAYFGLKSMLSSYLIIFIFIPVGHLKVLQFRFHFSLGFTNSLISKSHYCLIVSVIRRLGALSRNGVGVVVWKNTSKDVGTS